MGGFWKILLTAVLIFYAFNMIINLIFKRKARKLQRQMEESLNNDRTTQTEDETKPHVDPNIGEYTDYEEVE